MRTKAHDPSENRQITDLTLQEVDMVFSLCRIGEWSTAEIGRKYKISQTDVRKVFNSYAELREMLNQHPGSPQDRQTQLAVQPRRKKRCDAKFETAAEKQRAYRLRLKERQSVGIEPSPPAVTDIPLPVA